MKNSLLIFSIFCLSSVAFADPVIRTENCWSAADKAENAFAALEAELGRGDSYVLSIKSVEDCSAVSGARVQLGRSFSATSDNFGEVSLPKALFADTVDGTLKLSVSKQGFINYLDKMKVFFNEPHSSDTFVLLSPMMPPTSARVVLDWRATPRDLDLHLYGPNGMHVYYNGVRSGNASLVSGDHRTGFGHEIITVDNIDQNGQYKFYVHNYSRDANLKDARAKLYHNNTLVHNLDVRSTDRPAVFMYQLRNGNWSYPNTPTSLP